MSAGPKQSQAMSLTESVINIAVGLGVALAANAVVLPLVGFDVSLKQNVAIAIPMTVVSIARSFALRRLFEALHIRRPLSPGMLAVIAERQRQIDAEGYTVEHDNSHPQGELAKAGAAYAQHAADPMPGRLGRTPLALWPWDADSWKPQGFRRDLVRACALILADIERFDRLRRRKARA